MDRYRALGARPTFTCAPYQLADARPSLGEQVAWGESNAIAFCNSVLGARTNRYGDFLDIAAAITGRVPYAGLHRTDARRATLVLRLDADVPDALRDADVLFPVLGLVARPARRLGGGRHRRPARRPVGGPSQGARRRGGLVRIGGDVPRRGLDARRRPPSTDALQDRGAGRGRAHRAGGASRGSRRADDDGRRAADRRLAGHAARVRVGARALRGAARRSAGPSRRRVPRLDRARRPRAAAGVPSTVSAPPASSSSSTRAATSPRSCGTRPGRS